MLLVTEGRRPDESPPQQSTRRQDEENKTRSQDRTKGGPCRCGWKQVRLPGWSHQATATAAGCHVPDYTAVSLELVGELDSHVGMIVHSCSCLTAAPDSPTIMPSASRDTQRHRTV